MLCKNGVQYDRHVTVQGLIGVTVDDGTVFLVHMNDRVNGDGCSSADTSKPVQSSVEAEASSCQLHIDAVNEKDEAEACQWSKALEATASQYSQVKQESEASRTDLYGKPQNAADSPASLNASLSFAEQNKFWDNLDDVICVESTSGLTSVGNTCAASSIWNPFQYNVPSAAGQSEYDVSGSSAREICQIAKTVGSYAPVHSDNSQCSQSLGVKTEYGEMGMTHHLSTPKSRSAGISSSERRKTVIVIVLYMYMLQTN